MTELLLILLAVAVLASMAVAYWRSGGPLHPLMLLGPMLLYVFVARPGVLLANGQLQRWLPRRGQLEFAQLLFTAGVVLFCLGVLWGSRAGERRLWFDASAEMRERLFRLGRLLGFVAVAAYALGIMASGGFVAVYSRAKGYYDAGSGWINELVNLSIPAVALVLLSRQSDSKERRYIAWTVLFASPLLIHGLLGARRGPTFIILATLLVAWYISTPRRISLWKVSTRFGAIGLVVLFLLSHREQIYLGSNIDIDWRAFWSSVLPVEGSEGDDTVLMYGRANGVHETGTHYWGMRYAVNYLVRPIPRQIWPTKYQDLGLGWMTHKSDVSGIDEDVWRNVLGWVPVRGSAAGFIVDLYLEFSWAGLPCCWAFGWFFGWLWSRAARYAGLWTLLYAQAAALVVYVPTQSVSAVLHRFLVMAVPTVLIWRYYIGEAALRDPSKSRGWLLVELVNQRATRVRRVVLLPGLGSGKRGAGG